ncbi:MAG TPA: hypothetical protein VHD83_00555 [Puia sp.]|nr:hypothetical protein [Puia sp.]
MSRPFTHKKPPFRKLRGYAFDPSLSLKIDTVAINDIVYKVPWERLDPGPVGEYVAVIDYDPTVKKFYKAVDLCDDYILAQDGLDPSESDPQFHQQFVYAVAMTTIRNFEKALGRKIIWEPRLLAEEGKYEEYVPKLWLFPHAMRNANAYYHPLKKAILFGYFSSTPADETLHMPDSLVFTCLSHDIIAHETTHAILDGIHNYYNEATNPDVLAFHEAFADIVALFQHFTFPEVLKHQIAKTRGDLAAQNLLGQLAQEFGTAIGSYGSLRDAIGEIDKTTKTWKPKEPDPRDYHTEMEPHTRGSILVAAVFEAFLNIYKARVADLLRIASNGSGILPQGELHPDLVDRLAGEAAKAAGHVLNMCIRALDYCPPVDITFGDYLRAIITADSDAIRDDQRDYRLAFIDAFRRRGIYPEGIKTLSVESLRHPVLNIGYILDDTGKVIHGVSSDSIDLDVSEETKQLLGVINTFLRDYGNDIKYINDRQKIYDITRAYIGGGYALPDKQVKGLHGRINVKFSDSEDFARITGLAFVHGYKDLGIRSSNKYDGPSYQITKMRLVSRVGPTGAQLNQVVISLVQRCGAKFENGEYAPYVPSRTPFVNVDDAGNTLPDTSFEFRGGCTLIFDLDTQMLKYAISKPILDMENLAGGVAPAINRKRLLSQHSFIYGDGGPHPNEFAAYFGNCIVKMANPFSFLHEE